MSDALDDDALIKAFEDGSLPLEQWTHRAHVRVAFCFANELGLEAAIARMRAGLMAYNRKTNTPDALDRGYHETITLAFMRLIFAAAHEAERITSSNEFCARRPELLSKHVLDRHYSKARLMTMQAKREFVPPDRAPLPTISDHG